jgi:hypothetical protein
LSRSGIAVFNTLVSCKLNKREALIYKHRKRVIDPLIGAESSMTKIKIIDLISLSLYSFINSLNRLLIIIFKYN